MPKSTKLIQAVDVLKSVYLSLFIRVPALGHLFSDPLLTCLLRKENVYIILKEENG